MKSVSIKSDLKFILFSISTVLEIYMNICPAVTDTIEIQGDL